GEVGRNLNTRENRERLATIAQNQLNKARAEFDSTDFDYAVLLSDNSGLVDVKEKGQHLAKASYAATNLRAALSEKELSKKEQAEVNLGWGEIAYGSRNYKLAEKLFSNAKLMYEDEGLTNDLGYIKTLANQGLLYSTMGRYTQAEGFTAEALDMRRSMFGDNNTGVAASLNNYAVVKYNQARYNEAERDFESALGIMRNNNLEGSMPYAILLNNRAILFQGIGRFPEAEGALQEAVSISEKLKNSKSTNHLKFLS